MQEQVEFISQEAIWRPNGQRAGRISLVRNACFSQAGGVPAIYPISSASHSRQDTERCIVFIPSMKGTVTLNLTPV